MNSAERSRVARGWRAKKGEGGPMRAVKIPDDLWEAVGQMADRQGVSRNEIVRRTLRAAMEKGQGNGTTPAMLEGSAEAAATATGAGAR